MGCSQKEFYVGLDVGRESMEAVWVGKEGELIDNFSFTKDHFGYEEFLHQLHKLREAGGSVTVGAEGDAGDLTPLDQYLSDEGFEFLSIHPLKQEVLTSRYRPWLLPQLRKRY